METPVDIAIVVPAYNEEKTVSKVIETLYEIMSSSPYSFQLVVVDDGSKDDTATVARRTLESMKKPGDFSVFVQHEKNFGKGMAIRTAIPYVSARYVIIQDADLENDPHDILRMLDVMVRKNLKVLYGSRFLREKGNRNKHLYKAYYWGGRLVSFTANVLFGQRLTDEPTCYKMFDAELLKSIDLKCTGFEFCPEVTAKVAKKGYKIEEIPISYHPRTIREGKKLSWKDGLEAIKVLVKYRFVK